MAVLIIAVFLAIVWAWDFEDKQLRMLGIEPQTATTSQRKRMRRAIVVAKSLMTAFIVLAVLPAALGKPEWSVLRFMSSTSGQQVTTEHPTGTP